MQPWKEFSTKQSSWRVACLRQPAFWSRPAAEPSSRRPMCDCSRSPSPCLSPFYAPRSPKPSRCLRAYWPFRHTARRRASFQLHSPSCHSPSTTARAVSIAQTLCDSRARLPLSRSSRALCVRRCRRFRRHRFFAPRLRPAFSRFARAQRSPASASPGARGTRWPPRRFRFARGIAAFETRSIRCRRCRPKTTRMQRLAAELQNKNRGAKPPCPNLPAGSRRVCQTAKTAHRPSNCAPPRSPA